MNNDDFLLLVIGLGLGGFGLWLLSEKTTPFSFPFSPYPGASIPEMPTQNQDENMAVSPPISSPTPSVDYDTDILARTIYGEARGELSNAIGAVFGVGNVTKNRATDSTGRWPKSIAEVCLQTHSNGFHEFSCWNPQDVNYRKIIAVTTADPTFVKCLTIAKQITGNTTGDNVQGANFYHDVSFHPQPGSFWTNLTKIIQIGHLIFYRG